MRRVNLANWALRTPKFTTGVKYQFHQGFWPDQRSRNPNHPSLPHGTFCNNYLYAFTAYHWGLHFSNFHLLFTSDKIFSIRGWRVTQFDKKSPFVLLLILVIMQQIVVMKNKINNLRFYWNYCRPIHVIRSLSCSAAKKTVPGRSPCAPEECRCQFLLDFAFLLGLNFYYILYILMGIFSIGYEGEPLGMYGGYYHLF